MPSTLWAVWIWGALRILPHCAALAPLLHGSSRHIAQPRAGAWSGVRRNLTFIHIPRTAGRTIENLRLSAPEAESAPVPLWGWKDVAHQQVRSSDGKYVAEVPVEGAWVPHPEGAPSPRGRGFQPTCPLQHFPPNLNPTAFAGSDTFCVVRNPVSRMISEFGYGTIFHRGRAGAVCNRTGLNRYLRFSLMEARRNPYHFACHFLPQVAYVHAWNSSARGHLDMSNGQSCKHLLRYEHIAEDFDRLMKAYRYPIRFGEVKKSSESSAPECKLLTAADLDPDIAASIHNLYRDDYKLLAYLDVAFAKLPA